MDVDAEWAVLKKLAPDDARLVDEEADRRGAQAAEGCRQTCDSMRAPDER